MKDLVINLFLIILCAHNQEILLLKLPRIHNPCNDETFDFVHDLFCFDKCQGLLSITKKFLELLK